jgi:hypothetical protein
MIDSLTMSAIKQISSPGTVRKGAIKGTPPFFQNPFFRTLHLMLRFNRGDAYCWSLVLRSQSSPALPFCGHFSAPSRTWQVPTNHVA